MKTTHFKIKIISAALLIVTIAFAITSCQKDQTITPNDAYNNSSSEKTASYLFPSNPQLYDKWVAKWWKWDLQFDCAHFPTFDVDGSLQNQNQSGPIFFLAGNRHNATLSVKVPAGKAIFLPLATVESDYPCGTAVLDSLDDYTQGFVNTITDLSLTIDGHSVGNLSSYEVISPLFSTAANADLANCFDDCITGNNVKFVAGGYFCPLKPLSPGSHTIVRHAVAVGGAITYDTVYNITQL